MLGFYVGLLLEDPDANVIIIALHCCSGVFCKWWPIRYTADQPRPLATGKYAAANRRCWFSYNSCQWAHSAIRKDMKFKLLPVEAPSCGGGCRNAPGSVAIAPMSFASFTMRVSSAFRLTRNYRNCKYCYRKNRCYSVARKRLAVWCSGNALVLINAVALHRARLVLGWVTCLRAGINCLIIRNQPPRPTQPFILSGY